MPAPNNPNGVPSWSTNCMTGIGRVTPSGKFGGATVASVSGGTSPQVIFYQGSQPGGAEIGRCNLVAGTSYFPGASVDVPNGVWMAVTGNPRKFAVMTFVS